MFGDPIKSITDNLVKKTTNPFFGTYIVVWCIRKWEIIYSIFNFDDKVLLETKVEHIKTIYGFKYTLVDVSVNMLWTIGALIATYVFLNLSRLITNFSEDIIKPIIEKQTSQFRIVSKDKYHSIESSNRQILKDFEKLKKDIREKESLISKIEEEKNNSKTELERLNSKFIETKAYSIYYRLQLSNEEENFKIFHMKYGKNNFINYHVNDKKFDLETYKTFELLKEVEGGYVFTDIALYILKRIY